MAAIALAATTLPDAALAPSARAQEIGDPEAGGRLAREVCAECHRVGLDRDVPARLDAPAFPDIARTPTATPLFFRVFLRTPHAAMPDLILTEEEVDDVIAYIATLRNMPPAMETR